MTVKLPTELNLELLSLIVGCTGSYESTLVKMSHCWKSHSAAHNYMIHFILDTNITCTFIIDYIDALSAC